MVSVKGDTPDMLERHREGVRVRREGVARPDPQPLLCLDTGRLLARELERDEEQELAGLLTCSKKQRKSNFDAFYLRHKKKPDLFLSQLFEQFQAKQCF